MKKGLKITLIIFGIAIGIIFLDTIQALLFNNNPVIGNQTKCRSKQGIFVITYHCENGKNITKLKDSICSTEEVCNETINGSNNQQESKDSINNSNEEVKSVKAIINGKEYIIDLEDNETAIKFVSLLPQELNMRELNGNEKYIYLDTTLPTNSSNPKRINVGDVMLYGDNCLVIFYKSFDTSYSYTKIGHIDNLPNLGNDSISVKFEK